MKVRVQADGQNDEAISNHGDQIHSKEKHIEEILLLSLIGESQEEEFRDAGLVSLMHISVDLQKGNTRYSYPHKEPQCSTI